MSVKTPASWKAHALSTRPGIPSGPTALRMFTRLKDRVMSATESVSGLASSAAAAAALSVWAVLSASNRAARLRAANGLSIPYIGYIELDIKLCGRVAPKCGVLVVRDPPGNGAQAPGVLGMNVLGRCYQELFGQHGSSWFNSPAVSHAPKSVFQALQYCHQIGTRQHPEGIGKAKVRGP